MLLYGPGFEIVVAIFGIAAAILAIAVGFLIWRFRSTTGASFAVGFLLLAFVAQVVFRGNPANLIAQSFATFFSFPWHAVFESPLDESSLSTGLMVGSVINSLLVFIFCGIVKKARRRREVLR